MSFGLLGEKDSLQEISKFIGSKMLMHKGKFMYKYYVQVLQGKGVRI